MSDRSQLDKADVVDLVALSPSGDEVVLHLIATAPWDSEGERTMQLQAKLKNYIAFAADGGLLRQYPEVRGKKVRIHIDTAYPLGNLEQELVEAARAQWCDPERIALTVAVRGQ